MKVSTDESEPVPVPTYELPMPVSTHVPTDEIKPAAKQTDVPKPKPLPTDEMKPAANPSKKDKKSATKQQTIATKQPTIPELESIIASTRQRITLANPKFDKAREAKLVQKRMLP